MTVLGRIPHENLVMKIRSGLDTLVSAYTGWPKETLPAQKKFFFDLYKILPLIADNFFTNLI